MCALTLHATSAHLFLGVCFEVCDSFGVVVFSPGWLCHHRELHPGISCISIFCVGRPCGCLVSPSCETTDPLFLLMFRRPFNFIRRRLDRDSRCSRSRFSLISTIPSLLVRKGGGGISHFSPDMQGHDTTISLSLGNLHENSSFHLPAALPMGVRWYQDYNDARSRLCA